MQTVLIALGIMTGLSAFFAVVLALSDRFLRVEEDPRLEKIDDLLPGNNCGACGEPGCHAFAEKLIEGTITPGKCTVSTSEALITIADIVGVDVGDQEKLVARLKCASGAGVASHLAPYQGIDSCRAAALVNGGGRACNWGCLGLSDCEGACTFDAIHMNNTSLPVVDVDKCTACNDCVEICPLDLFTLASLEQHLFVQCNSPLEGVAARAICSVTCDACGRCAADAPGNTVTMEGGLPVVHNNLEELPSVASTWRCPTGAIKWLDKGQFEETEDLWIHRSIHG